MCLEYLLGKVPVSINVDLELSPGTHGGDEGKHTVVTDVVVANCAPSEWP